MLDYEAIREKALKEKPKMIIAGASAYSRTIDFKKFREICDDLCFHNHHSTFSPDTLQHIYLLICFLVIPKYF